MALYTYNWTSWGNDENHGMTEVLAPFKISIIKKIYWHYPAFRMAPYHHMHSLKSRKIAKYLYFVNFDFVEAEICFRIENQYTGRIIIIR